MPPIDTAALAATILVAILAGIVFNAPPRVGAQSAGDLHHAIAAGPLNGPATPGPRHGP
jgi:hypothetical protein